MRRRDSCEPKVPREATTTMSATKRASSLSGGCRCGVQVGGDGDDDLDDDLDLDEARSRVPATLRW